MSWRPGFRLLAAPLTSYCTLFDKKLEAGEVLDGLDTGIGEFSEVVPSKDPVREDHP